MISPVGQRILITDDQPRILATFGEILRREGYRVSTAQSGEEALKTLSSESIDLVIADLQMPGMDGIELTQHITAEWHDVPVIILTGHGSIESAVMAMKKGAADFLVKSLDPEELLIKLAKRLEERVLRSENIRLSAQVRRDGHYGEIIGTNKEMQKIFAIIDRVADTPSVVLISGDSGTGKELIARAIHKMSVSAKMKEMDPSGGYHEIDYPYVAVNCGAFSRSLLESQLFGHKKGTFSGAIADQEGVFAAARHGTLFLDEISELDFDLQVKLLRAIQEREFTPLGTTQPNPVHARIIAATNRNLADLVKRGEFRADLYYRINVVKIEVPSLAERKDDLEVLVDYFQRTTAETYRVAPREVSPEVMSFLYQYDWPGNVRELQNVIERVFALGLDEHRITLADLPPELLEGSPASRGGETPEPRNRGLATYDEVVKEHLIRALDVASGVKSKAAVLLGIDRNRLYRLMRKYGVMAPPKQQLA